MRCEICSIEGPTVHVRFRCNVGMLLSRVAHRIEGPLCRRCLHQSCGRMQMVNLLFGWWGLISFFKTAYFLIANALELRRARALGPLPPAIWWVRESKQLLREASGVALLAWMSTYDGPQGGRRAAELIEQWKLRPRPLLRD